METVEEIKAEIKILSEEDLFWAMFHQEVNKLPELWRKVTIDDIKEPKMELAKKFVREWNFENPLVFAIISQWTGIGKTHLLFCLWKRFVFEFLQKNKKYNYNQYLKDIGQVKREPWENNGIYYKWPKAKIISEIDIYSEVQSSYDEGELSEDRVMKSFYECNFLAIDGMFDERDNDFARRIIYRIIEKRLNWSCLPLAITSNKSADDIKEIDNRIWSRINEQITVNIKTKIEDFRGKRK